MTARSQHSKPEDIEEAIKDARHQKFLMERNGYPSPELVIARYDKLVGALEKYGDDGWREAYEQADLNVEAGEIIGVFRTALEGIAEDMEGVLRSQAVTDAPYSASAIPLRVAERARKALNGD